MSALVFVDANVLLAGSGSRSGASRAVLSLGEFGLIQLVATRQVLDEVERNLRLKLPAGLPVLAELLLHIQLRVLDNPAPGAFERWFSLIEPADAPLLEAALQAGAPYFLTLNSKHFTPAVAAATGLNILTPGEFVQQIRRILAASL